MTSAPKFKFIYAGDTRIAMIDDQGDVHFYLNDHLGSARRVIAENGLMQESYTYWAFGASRAESIAKNQAYRYTGKPFDDNESLDLYYHGARYYDPATGRFLAIDPLAIQYPGWGSYTYTFNNPLNMVDPDGRGPIAAAVKLGMRLALKNAGRRGVARAWAIEKNLLQSGKKTSMELSKKEQKELLKRGRVKGWVGHHINNVASNSIEMAENPNNIKFVKGQAEHLAEHGGSFMNKTLGPLIDRVAKLGGPALLAFVTAFDSKLNELLLTCDACSENDSWLSLVNPANAALENAALIHAWGVVRAEQAKPAPIGEPGSGAKTPSNSHRYDDD